MRKSKFTDTQIAAILKSVDDGKKVKDVLREQGISDTTYYKWRSSFAGMEEASNITKSKHSNDS